MSNKEIENKIWALLADVPDPEIPVLSILDLGVVRKIEINKEIEITITPTYSGCPAMNVFQDDIINKLKENDINNVKIKITYSPAWTTDWINEKSKDKLRDYGIAPPEEGTQDKGVLFQEGKQKVTCPYCKSKDTKLTSQFGSTACKSQHFCNSCVQPFEYFKCL
jgi:ring-1,2-phenylacetyl-CoA epoxidase subunit PaaD